jgi:PAS domain S-box-containing protein
MGDLDRQAAKKSWFGLLEAFLLFIVFLFLMDSALQYYVSSAAAGKASEEILLQTAVAIERKTAAIRETTEFLLLQTRSFVERKSLDLTEIRDGNAFFKEHMKAHPHITSVNYGDSAGNGYLILCTEDQWRNRVKKGTEEGTVTWIVTDNQGKVLSQERRKDDYDPRVRPWYINAAGSPGIQWSHPYIFRTTRDVGITASMAIESGKSKFPGVIGADVMLKDISRFFSDLKSRNKDLSIHLVSREGEILASSEVENFVRILRKDAGELPRISGGEFPDLAAAVQAFGTSGSDFLSFSSSGRSFYALRRPFRFSPDLNLSMILTVPQDSLLSFFGSMNRVRVILYLVMVAASGLFFASRYLAPLRKLTRATRTIGTGAYDPPPLSGRKDEVGILVSEFSRMAEDLSIKQGELTSLINNVPGVVYRGYPDWSLAFIGAEVKQVTGYASEEFTSGTARWKEIIHPQDIMWLKEAFRKAVREKSETVHVEYRIRRRDGGVRWISDRRQLIYQQNGVFAYVDGLLLDITELKKVEENLRESEDRYRDLVEHSQDLICTHDLEGRLVSVNPWVAKVLGYSQDEVLRMNMRDLIAPEVRDQFDGYLEEIGKRGAARGVLLVRTRSGERRIWEYNNTLRTEGVAEPVVRGMAHDITERKRAEKALRDAMRRLQLAATSGGLGIWEWDIQSDELHWDDRMFELYGISRESSLMGVEVWKKSLHPDDFLAAVDEGQAALRGEKEYDTEFRVVHPDGRVKSLQANAVVIRDADGKALRMIGINRDITERRSLEEQLRQSQKMEAVGRLAGGVAHDFNNLLTAIIGNVSLALMKLPLSDPAGDYLTEANKAAERATALVRQLLAFSRKQIIEPKVLDLNLLIADLNKMLVRLIGENIDLETVPGEDLGLVKVDAGQFEQVMVNLVVNARDAMPEGGKLLIETANVDLNEEYCVRHPYVQPGRFIMLAVSDTGHGMNKEVRKHIFEPFFTTKPRGSGTGLGLSTIYGVVKQSNGSIEVYSEVGKGTTFKIFLPRVEDTLEKARESGPRKELRAGTETVLLVEDEEIVRGLCFRLLDRLGYKVLQASNGDEALEVARARGERIDLLMTDVVMPGMNGRELAERLVALHPETKVLFTSGYTEDAIVHHGVLEGGVSFIGKPYSPSELAKKVREILDTA